MSTLVPGFSPATMRPWRTLPDMLSGHRFPRRARPGATRLPIAGLDDALLKPWLFKYWGSVIGLGQGMTYIPEESNVVYRSKDGRSEKTFDALEWLAAMCSHVPNKGEQIVRYYGYYSNLCRGRRKKADQDRLVPCILQPEESCKGYRKNWARFTRLWRADTKNRSLSRTWSGKIDPLTCPKCHGPMAIISFIEAEDVIEKILQRRTSPQAPRPLGGKTPATTPDGQSTAPIDRALYRLFSVAAPCFG